MFIPDQSADGIRTLTALLRRYCDAMEFLAEYLSPRARSYVGFDLWGWLQDPTRWSLHPLSLYLLNLAERRIMRGANVFPDPALVAEGEELWAQAMADAAKRRDEAARADANTSAISVQ